MTTILTGIHFRCLRIHIFAKKKWTNVLMFVCCVQQLAFSQFWSWKIGQPRWAKLILNFTEFGWVISFQCCLEPTESPKNKTLSFKLTPTVFFFYNFQVKKDDKLCEMCVQKLRALSRFLRDNQNEASTSERMTSRSNRCHKRAGDYNE